MPDILRGGILINEILVDPNGASNFDTDGNGTAASVDEFIELYNTSGSAIDISGLQLWDAGVGNWFTFPAGTILAAGAHALVMAGVQTGGSLPTGAPGDLFFDAGRASPLINNGGDNVVVYDPSADEYISATFNGDALDVPPGSYAGFSATATQSGSGEDFGNDTDGFSLQRINDGGGTFTGSETPTPGTSNVCFVAGTLIRTPMGDKPVETLRRGDIVMTADHGMQPIRWITSNWRSAAEIAQQPSLGAIRIKAGALGGGLPHRKLVVSRQHRLLVRSAIMRRMFGRDAVLVAAKDLRDLPGIGRAPVGTGHLYVHFLLPHHAVVLAEGAYSETLLLGKEASAALPARDLAYLWRTLPASLLQSASRPGCPLVKRKRARKLVTRHLANGVPLWTDVQGVLAA